MQFQQSLNGLTSGAVDLSSHTPHCCTVYGTSCSAASQQLHRSRRAVVVGV
jgi:hypothetical protein